MTGINGVGANPKVELTAPKEAPPALKEETSVFNGTRYKDSLKERLDAQQKEQQDQNYKDRLEERLKPRESKDAGWDI